VLVISGDRDAITLEHTLKIFHARPDAELCVLPGTDHATFSGRSEWLNPIISAFLDRIRNTASAVHDLNLQHTRLLREGEEAAGRPGG
jgi:hypothetical protein